MLTSEQRAVLESISEEEWRWNLTEAGMTWGLRQLIDAGLVSETPCYQTSLVTWQYRITPAGRAGLEEEAR